MVLSFDVFCKSGRKGVFHFEEPGHFSIKEYWLGSNLPKTTFYKKILWEKSTLKNPTLIKNTFIGKRDDFFYIEILIFLMQLVLLPYITYTMITGT